MVERKGVLKVEDDLKVYLNSNEAVRNLTSIKPSIGKKGF